MLFHFCFYLSSFCVMGTFSSETSLFMQVWKKNSEFVYHLSNIINIKILGLSSFPKMTYFLFKCHQITV